MEIEPEVSRLRVVNGKTVKPKGKGAQRGKGEDGISQRKDKADGTPGLWRGIIELPRDRGKRQTKELTARTKPELLKKMGYEYSSARFASKYRSYWFFLVLFCFVISYLILFYS